MNRPWIKPADVKMYTDISAVEARTDEKMQMDIARAEQYVIAYTHNNFSDVAYATTMPSEVLLAITLLAERYASTAIMSAKIAANSGKTSETFDDYSYSVGSTDMDVSNLNLGSLLDSYVKDISTGNISMKMRLL